MQKLMALLLTLTAVLSFAMPAFAEGTDGAGTTPPAASTHTITIKFEKPGHVYEAYQVFTGDYYNGKLSTIKWGSGVDSTGLLAALKADDFANAGDFETAMTASDVADVLANYGNNNSAKLDAFATVVGQHLTTVAAKSTEAGSDGKYVYTIKVPSDGYYFVKDADDVSVDDQNDAKTKYILQVLDTATINAKADVPDITKKIVNKDGTSERVQGDYNVGDTVYFKLESAVPDMDGYESYTFTVTDTLSSGLTYTPNSVKVTIGGEEYTAFTAKLDDKNVLTIDFDDFIAQKDNHGQPIVINYSAVLNKKALTKDKETNTVHLTYSNDPNTDSKGKTTEKKTYVYSFDINIYKHDVGDNDETKTPLNGAQFVLYRKATNKDNTPGREYYLYNAADDKVEWISQSDTTADTLLAAATKGEITSHTTDKDGKTSFTGLKAGTYHLQEIKAPDGYSLPDGAAAVTDVEIKVAYKNDGSIDRDNSTVTINNSDHMYITADITNKPGAVLPSTGGIGTTIFYVLGGVLTVAAIVLLIVKKRMENNQR